MSSELNKSNVRSFYTVIRRIESSLGVVIGFRPDFLLNGEIDISQRNIVSFDVMSFPVLNMLEGLIRSVGLKYKTFGCDDAKRICIIINNENSPVDPNFTLANLSKLAQLLRRQTVKSNSTSYLADVSLLVQMLFDRQVLNDEEKEAALKDMLCKMSGRAATDAGADPAEVEKAILCQAKDIAEACTHDMQCIIEGEILFMPAHLQLHWGPADRIEDPKLSDSAIAAANMAKMLVIMTSDIILNPEMMVENPLLKQEFNLTQIQDSVVHLSNIAKIMGGQRRSNLTYQTAVSQLSAAARVLEKLAVALDESGAAKRFCQNRSEEVAEGLKAIAQQKFVGMGA